MHHHPYCLVFVIALIVLLFYLAVEFLFGNRKP
jgi:hypothetical protein